MAFLQLTHPHSLTRSGFNGSIGDAGRKNLPRSSLSQFQSICTSLTHIFRLIFFQTRKSKPARTCPICISIPWAPPRPPTAATCQTYSAATFASKRLPTMRLRRRPSESAMVKVKSNDCLNLTLSIQSPKLNPQTE